MSIEATTKPPEVNGWRFVSEEPASDQEIAAYGSALKVAKLRTQISGLAVIGVALALAVQPLLKGAQGTAAATEFDGIPLVIATFLIGILSISFANARLSCRYYEGVIRSATNLVYEVDPEADKAKPDKILKWRQPGEDGRLRLPKAQP